MNANTQQTCQISGFVNVDKPASMTSSDVVVKVRGILTAALGYRPKTGHLGTLDPMGTGVLPIAVGTATRLFDYLAFKRKKYAATFAFGNSTDTLDSTGTVIASGGRVPSESEIRSVLPRFIGKIQQVPPLYSAKSVGGKRAYEYARRGENIELQPRNVEISEIVLTGVVENGFNFEIVCGGGTYIRSLAADIASALGTYGIMTSIRRLQSGPFSIEASVSPDTFSSDPLGFISPLEIALTEFGRFALPENCAAKVLNGMSVAFDNLPAGVFVVTLGNKIVGMGENENGYLKIRTRL